MESLYLKIIGTLMLGDDLEKALNWSSHTR